MHIDARRRRRRTADPFAGPAPRLAAILDDERLGDQPARERLRRPANAQHFGGQTPIDPARRPFRAGAQAVCLSARVSWSGHGARARLFPYNLRHECRRAQGRAPHSVQCFIVTVSDTRTLENDASGRAIADLLTAAGHVVTGRTLVRDDPELVHSTIERHLADRGVQVIITTGGTGITSRDSTYEAISTLLEKRLDGFGELFRMLSYQQIGPAAMLSRACAGLVRGRIVIALPGSPGAVTLAMEKLVIPELGHLVQQASK